MTARITWEREEHVGGYIMMRVVISFENFARSDALPLEIYNNPVQRHRFEAALIADLGEDYMHSKFLHLTEGR